MTPILGVIASQITGHLSTNSFESIATVTGAGTPTSITFSSIPSTYKHLQIRYIAARSSAGGAAALRLAMNGSTSVYRNHLLEGDGATVGSGTVVDTNGILIYGSYSGAAPTFGAGVIDILDYANTNKYKTTRSLTGVDFNGSGYVDFDSGLFMSTSAISSIVLSWDSGYAINTNSSFALYGVKG